MGENFGAGISESGNRAKLKISFTPRTKTSKTEQSFEFGLAPFPLLSPRSHIRISPERIFFALTMKIKTTNGGTNFHLPLRASRFDFRKRLARWLHGREIFSSLLLLFQDERGTTGRRTMRGNRGSDGPFSFVFRIFDSFLRIHASLPLRYSHVCPSVRFLLLLLLLPVQFIRFSTFESRSLRLSQRLYFSFSSSYSILSVVIKISYYC